MLSNEVAAPEIAQSARLDQRTPVFPRARWWQVTLNVAYVLVAGPRGLLYLLLIALGLALDVPRLALRLLLAATLGLLYGIGRAILWLLRFGLRFLWVGLIVILVWALQSLWWVFISVGITVTRIISTVLVDIIYPRSAWQRAMRSMRDERERIQTPRSVKTVNDWSVARPMWWRGERFLDAWTGALRRLRDQVVPERWIFVPAIWRRLALWERRHTMRWLNIALPALGPEEATPAGRAALRAQQLPLASLGFLLAKVPIGGLALAIVVLETALSTWLIDIDTSGGVIVIALVAIYVLHMLGLASAAYAQRAFSPSPATLRLHAAEAIAAQERGKAERAEQSRRDLIINVGHELRTPTASILGHVESILLTLDTPDGHVPPDTLRTYLGIVQREAERLSLLVDDLLAVARAERSELQLVFGPVDAAAVIHEVYQALAPLARRERQVMLVHEEQPDLPPLLADRQRLSQVLLNLVRNAITYTPPGGIVSIGLRREGDRLLLTVADTGSGIAPADLERVFERFYRTDESRARSSGGFGLGLAIARDLVEAMGGTITAESIVGEGSTFHVWLPIAT